SSGASLDGALLVSASRSFLPGHRTVSVEVRPMSMSIKHWQDPLNLILGIWMIASPWALNYSADKAPTWNAVILGILIGAAALFALFRVMAWEEWGSVALGVWLVISPWLLGFSSMAAAMWNAMI